MKNNAYIYARISADMAEDEHGVKSQIRQCTELINQNGWNLAGEYVDNDLSAFSGVTRPSFEQLLVDMRNGKVPRLVVWHLDRLCRRVQDMARVVESAQAGGTEIATVKAGEIDLNNASGELMAYMLSVMGQYEAKHSSERQIASQHDRALKGIWRGGRPPFGYTISQPGRLEIDPKQSRWIKQWSTWLQQGESVLAIIRMTKDELARLEKLGESPDYLTKMNRSVLRARLTNPAIAGLVREKGEIIGEAAWEPILSEDEYQTVCAILRDPARRTTQSFERKWQGSGVYVCGKCGDKMRVAKSSSAKKVRLYACRDNAHLSIYQQDVDNFVNEVVIGYLSDPDRNVLKRSDDSQILELTHERSRLASRKDDLAVAFAEGEIDRSQLNAGSRSLDEKLARVDRQLAALARHNTVLSLASQGEQVADRWERLSPDKRARVIGELMTVTILPVQPGKRRPIVERIKIDWK